ncbi:hypothetical protein ACFW16_32665 [Inquilinus sp. NPDC058860]|uniref:hypothetical protein n=1 Tax=Inquilinus sp. NPDC058860 TaxID=3346652 RepID=UPI003684204E
MPSPTEIVRSTLAAYGSYIEDAFGSYASEVSAAWDEVLTAIDAHVRAVELSPGFFARWVEFDSVDGERDADDQRSVVRIEFISQVIPDTVMHLSTENTDAVPRLDILTTMRRGVGLLDREWDELDPAVAIKRFIDRHNARAAAETR